MAPRALRALLTNYKFNRDMLFDFVCKVNLSNCNVTFVNAIDILTHFVSMNTTVLTFSFPAWLAKVHFSFVSFTYIFQKGT